MMLITSRHKMYRVGCEASKIINRKRYFSRFFLFIHNPAPGSTVFDLWNYEPRNRILAPGM